MSLFSDDAAVRALAGRGATNQVGRLRLTKTATAWRRYSPGGHDSGSGRRNAFVEQSGQSSFRARQLTVTWYSPMSMVLAETGALKSCVPDAMPDHDTAQFEVALSA